MNGFASMISLLSCNRCQNLPLFCSSSKPSTSGALVCLRSSASCNCKVPLHLHCDESHHICNLKGIFSCFLQICQLVTTDLNSWFTSCCFCSCLPFFTLLVLFLSLDLEYLYVNFLPESQLSTVSPTRFFQECFTYREIRLKSCPLSCLPQLNQRSCTQAPHQIDIQNRYLTANRNLVKIYLLLNNNLCILKDFLDLFDTSLDISLLILCCIVLSVLR